MTSWQKLLCVLNISTLVLLFCIDRLSKAWALQSLHGTRVLIPNLLQLSLVQNTNIVFWLHWSTWVMLAIVALVMIIVVAIVVQQLRRHEYLMATALTVILLGAYSNFWDRLQHGAVTDFISVPFWSVFNFADIYIVCGVVAVALLMHFDKRHKTASL